MTDEEKNKIEQQDINVIKSGRNPNLKVMYKNIEMSIDSARKELVDELKILASEFKENAFISAIENIGDFKKNKFNQEESFQDYGLKKAKENYERISSFSNIDVGLCEKEASDSLREFDKMNREKEIAFDNFINSYNSKI